MSTQKADTIGTFTNKHKDLDVVVPLIKVYYILISGDRERATPNIV